MSGMFLVVQVIFNNSPSLIVASGNIGSLKANRSDNRSYENEYSCIHRTDSDNN